MSDVAGGIVDLVVCDDDLCVNLAEVVESRKLSTVSFVFDHTVSDLNIILLVVFLSKKINFSAVVVIDT